jgi:1,4-dihydroxy-6-naphthoate synthase
MKISLAFSPCPNDTFIFDAMVHHKIDTEGLEFDVHLEDVETLNNWAMEGRMMMTKVSYHAWLYLTETYSLLDSGSALGKGNGPLLISKNNWPAEKLSRLTIAVPGEYTTAHLLLKIAYPEFNRKQFMVFSEIESAILGGSVGAGVIIHENRFTYASKGLVKIADLGDLWEQRTHLPIPLGGIVALKHLGEDTINKLNRVMYRSVKFAMEHPDDSMDYVREYAQEMDEEVMKKHIGLYVNDFTLNLGEEGQLAVQKLFEYTGLK